MNKKIKKKEIWKTKLFTCKNCGEKFESSRYEVQYCSAACAGLDPILDSPPGSNSDPSK